MVKKRKNKKNTQSLNVTFELYFNPYIKDNYTRIYDVLLETHNRTYEAIYKEIKENPQLVYGNYLKDAKSAISNNYYSEDADPSSYYEQLEEYVVERMQEQSLMHYQFELMSLSNLYQVFEQQLRKWLFEEMTHRHNQYINQIEFVLNDEEKDYGYFYSKFEQLQNVLKEMNLTFTIPSSVTEWAELFGDVEENGIEVPIVETEIWKTIRECNLISNTFKHGSGKSAKELYKLHPEYFETVISSDTKLMNLYRTTNMEEVLCVERISFEKYVKSMKSFWEKLKMHQSGSVMLEINTSSEEV
ncbi:hypothetical protein GJU41_02965 [Bacillus idriensis]|uniref:Uncharacterized protein n=1 Tax=Metabacillus idriensis TaxID=324768 RepID=A0A6I2M6B8_9BACI|nr:hypothetical protein [Metabacillus idriensis]MRX52922.1 hypothetical protein [Metabacillus idriensis]